MQSCSQMGFTLESFLQIRAGVNADMRHLDRDLAAEAMDRVLAKPTKTAASQKSFDLKPTDSLEWGLRRDKLQESDPELTRKTVLSIRTVLASPGWSASKSRVARSVWLRASYRMLRHRRPIDRGDSLESRSQVDSHLLADRLDPFQPATSTGGHRNLSRLATWPNVNPSRDRDWTTIRTSSGSAWIVSSNLAASSSRLAKALGESPHREFPSEPYRQYDVSVGASLFSIQESPQTINQLTADDLQ